MKNRDSPASPPHSGGGPAGPRADTAPTISSAALLAGAKELLIRHGGEEYRLRITANNKLILTK
jgi:hemin uptake protein HemP